MADKLWLLLSSPSRSGGKVWATAVDDDGIVLVLFGKERGPWLFEQLTGTAGDARARARRNAEAKLAKGYRIQGHATHDQGRGFVVVTDSSHLSVPDWRELGAAAIRTPAKPERVQPDPRPIEIRDDLADLGSAIGDDIADLWF